MAIKPGQNQLALIDDLPEHAKNAPKVKAGLRAIRDDDKNVAINPKIIYVQTLEKLRECAQMIEESRIATIDTETRGVRWVLGKKAVSLNVYTPCNDRAYFIPVRMVHAQRNFEDWQIQEVFEDVLANSELQFVGHNFTFDRHFMRETWNLEVASFHHDTMLASRILNENEAHGLDDLCIEYLGAKQWKKPMSAAFELWPIRTATQYAGMDAMMTWKLYEFQRYHLEQLPKLYSLFYDWEMPTARKAYEMERTGVCYDDQYHDEVMQPFVAGLKEEAKAKIVAQVGDINLESNPQLASAVFDMLGAPRINEDHLALAELSDLKKMGWAIAGDILEYRQWSTIEKMFVNRLKTWVVNGKIHCTFNTIGADTGRMSCKEPNLQQLPKRVGPVIRRAIVPSPGCVFVTMDYSQMELRVLAHFSEDPGMISAFVNGVDIHTAVMCGVLGVSEEEYKANPDHPPFAAARVKAKTVNFGVLYGMGATKLAWKLGIPEPEAKEFIDAYKVRYPGVQRYITQTKIDAYKIGYVETIIGRKRRLPDARSGDKIKSSMAEREAVNARIQGSVADMVKMAALKQEEMIVENGWPFELLLQIHDELLYEVPRAWLEHHQGSLTQLKQVMENVYPLRVPIEVNLEVLERWGNKTRLDEYDDEDVA